jgi:hypothetical protein
MEANANGFCSWVVIPKNIGAAARERGQICSDRETARLTKWDAETV